jgi:hypothetical protein
MSLGPFDPLAISAGMLTNFGYDILKQRARSLDGTLAGKMLKWAGIIEPNFEERIGDTINKASALLLKGFPQYDNLIASFPLSDFTRVTIEEEIRNTDKKDRDVVHLYM